MTSAKQIDANCVVAPANGELLPLAQCSDRVFAKGMLGPGFVIKPTDGYVYSPVAGTVKLIHATKHGYVITTAQGQDVLVHLGIDTAGVDTKHFHSRVHVGDHVDAGANLADAHWGAVRAAGGVDELMVVVSEAAPEAISVLRTGQVIAGEQVAQLN